MNTSPPTTTTAPASPSKKVLPAVLLAALLTTLNTAIVNVALSGIREGLGFSATDISWVINAYLLMYGGLLIVGGRLGDIIGRRQALLIGLSVFVLGSLTAGAAWRPAMLIFGRALQGIGAALTAPSVLATIAQLYHGPDRTRALSWFSVVIGGGLSLGMVLGGVILQWLSWRWIFWLNVPAGVALLLLIARCVPSLRSQQRHRLDLIGAMLAMTSTVGIVFAFIQLARRGDTLLGVGVSLTVSATAFVALRTWLQQAAEPLVPLTLFARKAAVVAFAINGLLAAAMSGLIFFLSLLFSKRFDLSPLGVGALFLVFTAPQLMSAWVAERLLRRISMRTLIMAGLLSGICGMVLIAAASCATGVSPQLVSGMVLAGIGAGGVFLGANLMAMSAVDAHMAGAASGVLQTFVQLGASIGIALLVLVHSWSGNLGVFLAAATMLAIGMVAIFMRGREPSPHVQRSNRDAVPGERPAA